MTRKDYKIIAKAIAKADCKEALVNELCRVFKEDNPNFDAYKFCLACERGGKGAKLGW